MKTTFKQYLQEATLPPAESEEDLLASIKDGKFTKDGSHLSISGFINGFNCSDRELVSLEGAPSTVSGSFNCAGNKLSSLKGAPQIIGSFFRCTGNRLTSLEGAPSKVHGNFYCQNNELVSLKGGPASVGGSFFCNNNQLASLEDAPKLIGVDISYQDNNLITLKDIHKQIHSIGNYADFSENPIKSHVLGLLKIKGLREISLDNREVERIINKYLPEGDMFACQQELIDAGFDAFAQL